MLLFAGAISLPVVATFADSSSAGDLIVPVHLVVMSLLGALVGRLVPGLAGARSSSARQAVVGAFVGLASGLAAVGLFSVLL